MAQVVLRASIISGEELAKSNVKERENRREKEVVELRDADSSR